MSPEPRAAVPGTAAYDDGASRDAAVPGTAAPASRDAGLRDAAVPGTAAPRHLRLVPAPALRVLDVAMFYGARSGGIRTYLDAKRAWAAGRSDVEHHLVVPGVEDVTSKDGRMHQVRALPLRFANGYRVPAGTAGLVGVLDDVRPDVVLLHDPYWRPVRTTAAAHRLGARVVAVRHGSPDLDAAAFPGPNGLYARPLLASWIGRAERHVDAVMSATGLADVPLRLGLEPAFTPQRVARRDHVLYAGRLQRQKGVFTLLEAAARSEEPWELHLMGSGPAEDAVLHRADRLGIAGRVTLRPFEQDRNALARRYAQARCVVMPGEHETFGLVALEAAASGARVVACASAPSARTCGVLADCYAPGDVDGLVAAIARARARRPDPLAAATLAAANAWPACFAAELADLRTLVA